MTSFLFASLAIATPAHATGGLLCQPAGPKQIEVTLGFENTSFHHWNNTNSVSRVPTCLQLNTHDRLLT